MWKKIFITVSLIIILIIGIEIFNVSRNNEEDEQSNIVKNETEISQAYVTDDCIDEWEDYSLAVQEEIEEASQILNDENRSYIVKEKDGLVNVYYINEKKEEILYRATDISVKYLGEGDIENLKKGIVVIGIQELNKLLEDFE